jgi:hypothetical protein
MARRWVGAASGPALIVLGPLIVLHGFWFAPHLTDQHVDLLSFWLPRWCHLGNSIVSGHVPTWLPNQFGGVPFASDPQSGWLHAPAMLLFAVVPCTRALGLSIVLNPVLAGLGIYLFFRHEGLRRVAATTGGVTLALTISGSEVVLSLPFSGVLAWTAMALAGASGYLCSRAPPRILGWLAFTAFALSQVAGAHLTHGLLMAVLVLVLFVAARSIAQVRAGERSGRAALLMGAGLFAAFPLLAAAVLLPRLALIPRTSLGHGYTALERMTAELSGPLPHLFLQSRGITPWWGTSFARGPGGYVGAMAILLIAVALSSRRWRLPATAFAVAGIIGWLLNLDWVIRNEAIRRFALGSPLGELWLRAPSRFRYLPILAFAGLAGYGLQAWIDLDRAADRLSALRRAMWFLPPAALFALWPIAAGSSAGPYLLLGVGSAVGIPVLLLGARGVGWAIQAIPAIVALELVTAGSVPLLTAGPVPPRPSAAIAPSTAEAPVEPFGHSFPKLLAPSVDRAAYTRPGRIGQTLIDRIGEHGRYLTFDPQISQEWRGFLTYQSPASWPAYENGRSILFGLQEVQGYSPIQPDRFWRLVRRLNPVPIFYNAATFQVVDPEALGLFGVRWLITPAGLVPPAPSNLIAREGSFDLHELTEPSPRASMVFAWRLLSAERALDAVLRTGFDPGTEAVVEEGPTLGGVPLTQSPTATGTATYVEKAPNDVLVNVTASAPGLLVVRNSFDRNWHATVDGEPAPVLIADYAMQAVAVPAGAHVVELRYRDGAIGAGLAVSAVAWGSLLAAAWILARRLSAGHTPPQR